LAFPLSAFVLPSMDFLGQFSRIPWCVDVPQVIRNSPSQSVLLLGVDPTQRTECPSRQRSPSRGSRAFARGRNSGQRIRSGHHGAVAFVIVVDRTGDFRTDVAI
jgi:hypothetical protein